MDQCDGQSLGLAPISLADQFIFQRAFAALTQPISDYSFANTFVWGTSLKLYWRRSHDHLLVFANGTGDLTLLMPPLPLTDGDACASSLCDALHHAFDIMDGYNDRHTERSRSRIEYVSDEMLERIHSVTGFGGRGLTLSTTPMGGDYIYDAQSMIDLAGGALKSKRHARSRFMRDFPDHRLVPLESCHLSACEALLEQWQHHGDEAHDGEVTDTQLGTDILRHRETLACHHALHHHAQLALTARALVVGEKVIGFTLGETLSSAQASILFEKTHPDYPGAAQFIFSEFCRQCWSHLPHINAGDDWGVPSLRFTKSSYRPVRMLGKSTLTRQPTVVVAGFGPSDLPESSPRHCPAEETTTSTRAHETIVLRHARPDDVPAMVELETCCFQSPQEMFNRRQLRSLVRNPRAAVHVLEADGQLVGWAVGLVRQHRRSRSGRLYALAIHPAMRGRGLGAHLARHCIHVLHQRDIASLYLEVRRDNAPAIHLYQRLGFIPRKELPNYYGPQMHGLRMKLGASDQCGRASAWCAALMDQSYSIHSMRGRRPASIASASSA